MTDTQPQITANCGACGAELVDGVRYCDQCGRGVLTPADASDAAPHPPSRQPIPTRIIVGVAVVVAAMLIAFGVSTGGHGTASGRGQTSSLAPGPSLDGAFMAGNGQSWTFSHGSFTSAGVLFSCTGQYTLQGSIGQLSCVAGDNPQKGTLAISGDANVIGVADANSDGTSCLVRTGSTEATANDTSLSDICDKLIQQAQGAR